MRDGIEIDYYNMYRYLYIYIKINFPILLYSRIIDRFNRRCTTGVHAEGTERDHCTGGIDRSTLVPDHRTAAVRFLSVAVSRSPFPFENRRNGVCPF